MCFIKRYKRRLFHFILTFAARVVKNTAMVPAVGHKQCVIPSPYTVFAKQLSRSHDPVLSIRPHDVFQELV